MIVVWDIVMGCVLSVGSKFSHLFVQSWGRPLHSAMGNRRIVELLLRHGADPSLRSSDGHTAFHLAEQLDRGTLNWLNCFVKLRSGRLAAVWCMNNMRGVWPDLVEVVIDRLVATEVEHWEE